MMRAAQARKHQIFVSQVNDLKWDGKALARATRLSLTDNDEDWYRAHETASRALADFAAVLMRKDPPFDLEYVVSTWLLSAAVREGAKVFNAPDAVRDHNEKLAIAEFPQFVTPTLVTREPQRLQPGHARRPGAARALRRLGGPGAHEYRPLLRRLVSLLSDA